MPLPLDRPIEHLHNEPCICAVRLYSALADHLNRDAEKGKPIVRWGRKASGLKRLMAADSGVAGCVESPRGCFTAAIPS